MSEHKYKEAWAKGVEDGRKMQMIEDCFNCTFDGPTNGDILMHLFPETTVTYHPQYILADSYVTVSIKGCDTVQDYSLAFWDAPFTPNLKLTNEGNTIIFPKYKGEKHDN